jgi:hypothetical protein
MALQKICDILKINYKKERINKAGSRNKKTNTNKLGGNKMKSNFVKTSELAGDDRSKVKGYFSELYGPEYAAAMVKDYEPEGEKKEVAAKSKKRVK